MKKDFLKFPLRKALFSTVILFSLSAIFSSCGDDMEGRISVNNAAPEKVTNVKTEAGPGEVYLTWTNPTNESFMYTKIEYTTSKGEKKYQLISKENADNGVAKATVSGFANTDPVTFSIFSCSVKGNNKGAVEVTAEPDTPAFAVVAETVEIETQPGGVNVSWNNESVAPVYVVLDYYSKSTPSKTGSTKILAAAGSKEKRFVPLTYETVNYFSGEDCVINVTTQDAEENASEVFPFEVAVGTMEKLPKADWKFPDYNDSSNDGTIGYSSQETVGEGAVNGRVITMLDNDPATFWHTAWKTSSAYPHFFIIDMGKDYQISHMDIRRRLGNNGTHKGQTFYTCSNAAAVDKNKPDSWGWEEQGHYSFDPNTDTPQLFRFPSPATARYVKVSFAESDKGSSNFVMISEVNVFSPEK